MHAHHNIGGLDADNQVVIAKIFDHMHLIQRTLYNPLCRYAMIFFYKIFFEGTAVYADTDRNIAFPCNTHYFRYTVCTADVSGIDTDFIRSVFHRGDRHLIIEMNVCNQRNGNLLSDLRNRFRSFQRRYGAADNFTTNLFQSVNLRNRRRHILGRRVGHRLNQDRIAASDYTVSNFYDFGMISVHNALRFIASAFFLFKSPVIFILTLPHRQCNRFPANEFCCPTCRLLPKMPFRYSCASPEMHPV